MAEYVATGLTGNIVFTSATPVVNARFGRFRVRVTYEPLNVTGFGATMRQRAVGLGDLQGVANGYVLSGDTAANPGLSSTTTPSLAVVTLQCDGTISQITATCMVSMVELGADIDATTGSTAGITFLGAGAHIAIYWGGGAVA